MLSKACIWQRPHCVLEVLYWQSVMEEFDQLYFIDTFIPIKDACLSPFVDSNDFSLPFFSSLFQVIPQVFFILRLLPFVWPWWHIDSTSVSSFFQGPKRWEYIGYPGLWVWLKSFILRLSYYIGLQYEMVDLVKEENIDQFPPLMEQERC